LDSTGHRKPSNSLPLLTAITGFVNYKTAQGPSQRSIDSYKRILDQWAEYAGNQKFAQINDSEINKYLVYLRTEYVPRRFSGKIALSPKSLRNICITLCAFFTWAHTEFRLENPMKRVPGPRFQKVDVEPFTQEEIEHMLKVCTYSRETDTFTHRKFAMRRRRPIGTRRLSSPCLTRASEHQNSRPCVKEILTPSVASWKFATAKQHIGEIHRLWLSTEVPVAAYRNHLADPLIQDLVIELLQDRR
jgi:integrase